MSVSMVSLREMTTLCSVGIHFPNFNEIVAYKYLDLLGV